MSLRFTEMSESSLTDLFSAVRQSASSSHPYITAPRPIKRYATAEAQAAKTKARFERKTAHMTRPQAGREAESVMLEQARKLYDVNARAEASEADVIRLKKQLEEVRAELVKAQDGEQERAVLKRSRDDYKLLFEKAHRTR